MKTASAFRLVLLVVLVNASAAVPTEPPEVRTNFGPVSGIWLKTARGADVAGFLGLPYAEPPLGDLRFENPRPWSEKWTEVRNATSDGSMCMQMSNLGVIGDEDCLYLNVFTPATSVNASVDARDKKKLSVLVFVHGGSYNTGSSNSTMFAPTYLLDHEIILVTMNYRLNVLGFFSTGNGVAPGNYGLKDIAAALGWVNENIGAFGGNPESVTLLGHSSGAASVHLLSASKATEGLFHKLITMSGSALTYWAVHSRENIRNSSMFVVKSVGCENGVGDFEDPGSGDYEIEESSEMDENDFQAMDFKIVECMKEVNASVIVDSIGSFNIWRGNPVCVFGPTLEEDVEGAILTVHPERSMSEGLFRDIPWITGVTSEEGSLKTIELFLYSEIKSEFLENNEKVLPYVLEMEDAIDNVTAAIKTIKDFYFNGDVETNLDANVTQLVGDAIITWPTYNALRKQSAKMKSNVYYYLFSYQGTFSSTFRWGIPFRFGTSHGDDLNYIFPYLNAKFADLQLFNTMSDRTMINVMSEMWTNFVKTGTPSARLTVTWEPYGDAGLFMKLGERRSTNRTMETNFLPERMNFWSEFVKNYSKPIAEYRVNDDYDEYVLSKGSVTGIDNAMCIYVLKIWLWKMLLY